MTMRFLPLVFTITTASLVSAADAWKVPDLASSDELRLSGLWGKVQARSANRMAQPPLDKPSFILADLSQKMKRRYIDYSGDVSGRWIGAATFLAPLYPEPFAAFPAIMAEIPSYQRPDGHFGVDQDLSHVSHDRDMAILWGNGRLLIGLIEVYDRNGDPKVLETARRIGDYLIATDAVFNKPESLIRRPGGYSANCETYTLSVIEGLVALARVTKDKRHLDQARRTAELAMTVKDFDSIHSHGRLCADRGIADLYALTGDPRWLAAVERDWQIFIEKHRLPTGGVKEVLEPGCDRDEGCAESDWLRLNLSLARLTGNGRYLDEAQRCLNNHFIVNQYPNGGGSHRTFHQIHGQPVAFQARSEEAWWCCSEHWARATVDIARCAASSTKQALHINLIIDGDGTIAGPGGKWKITLRETDDGLQATLTSPVSTKATVRIHRPAWAREGARIEKPAALSLSETPDAWLIDGAWNDTQAIAVHLPTTLRSEAAPGNAGVLLHGNDLLAAHQTPNNAWLTDALPKVRPVVLWAAALPMKEGRIVVPASLDADADPTRPRQWKLLELAPLRSVAGQPHRVAWFSFQLRAATAEHITDLIGKIR